MSHCWNCFVWRDRAEAAEAREAELRGEVTALASVNARERNDRKDAEKRAREAEKALTYEEDYGYLKRQTRLRAEVERETIAAVVAWLEKRAYDGNENEIALMVDALARGDWRPKGREGGE